MSILTSIPFNWIYGSSIIATFSSGNRIGYRLISPENTIGAWIQIVPLKPNVAPLSNPLTSTTHVQVIITELTVIKTKVYINQVLIKNTVKKKNQKTKCI